METVKYRKTGILPQIGLEHDVEFNYRIKMVHSIKKLKVWFVTQIWDARYINKVRKNKVNTNIHKKSSLQMFVKIKIVGVKKVVKI